MNRFVNSEHLFSHLGTLLDMHFRGATKLVISICDVLLEMPDQPIDFGVFVLLVEHRFGQDLTKSNKTYIRRFLQGISDLDGPVQFLLPHRTHFIFFSNYNLNNTEKAVTTARISTFLHLSEQLNLPHHFNFASLQDVDHAILAQLN